MALATQILIPPLLPRCPVNIDAAADVSRAEPSPLPAPLIARLHCRADQPDAPTACLLWTARLEAGPLARMSDPSIASCGPNARKANRERCYNGNFGTSSVAPG